MNYQSLTFGTAGIRGIMGNNPGELNNESISAISHCLAQVFKEDYNGGKVVFCYDSRKNGKKFALCAANVINSYGFDVYITKSSAPTPFLSYAVKKIGAIGGVNITASHNPKEYTGYKAYAGDGAQIDIAFAQRVQEKLMNFVLPKEKYTGTINEVSQEIYSSYLHTIAEKHGLATVDFGFFSALYTPLFGSAGELMKNLVQKTGIPIAFVEEQMMPNGDFPGLPKPNPDDTGVFDVAMTYKEYPLLLANDPDGDRLGAMVLTKTGYRLLSGNEIGILLLYYLLITTENVKDKFIVKSLVSTDFAQTLCADYGISVKNTLVGFRYIAKKMEEDKEHFLFGFEESGGYLASPHAGDKDGIEAACLLLKAGAYFFQQGKTLIDVLDNLYKTYGKVTDITLSIDLPLEKSAELMAALRKNPPNIFCGKAIDYFEDYSQRNDEMQGNLIAFRTKDASIILRPSGTEPKMKVYCSVSIPQNQVEKEIDALFASYI